MAVDHKMHPNRGVGNFHMIEVVRLELLEVFGTGVQIEQRCLSMSGIYTWIKR